MLVLLRRGDEALQTVGGAKRKGLSAYVQTRGDLRPVQFHATYRVDGLVARCSADAAGLEERDLLGHAFERATLQRYELDLWHAFGSSAQLWRHEELVRSCLGLEAGRDVDGRPHIVAFAVEHWPPVRARARRRE